MMGGGGFGGMGGGYAPDGYGVGGGSFTGMGGGNIMGMLGGAGGGDMMGMIPQLMRMANVGGGPRRHRRGDHFSSSLRGAPGSRECAPDDRLRDDA